MGANTWTGKMLGKYEVGEMVGQGGMAQVYKGHHPALKRDVAIKLIHSYLVNGEGFIQRFQREAQLVAALRHPNIVQVYDFDIQESVYYMVMEFINGQTLASRLEQLHGQNKLMSFVQDADLLISLCSALDFAHAQGMVHRDVKPGNVMFTVKGQPVLTDFGLAKIVAGSTNSASGLVVGTPMYMSPEQACGESGDARSDIYALGVILFELATGRTPFQGDTPLSIALKQIKDPLPSPRQINPLIPGEIEQIITRATEKKPENRYQNCADLAEDLQKARLNLPDLPAGPVTPLPVRSSPPSDRLKPVPIPKTISLENLRSIYLRILGPVGRIMDVNRIAQAMHENPTTFPLDRLDELLERVATQYRLNDLEKKNQIRKDIHKMFGN